VNGTAERRETIVMRQRRVELVAVREQGRRFIGVLVQRDRVLIAGTDRRALNANDKFQGLRPSQQAGGEHLMIILSQVRPSRNGVPFWRMFQFCTARKPKPGFVLNVLAGRDWR